MTSSRSIVVSGDLGSGKSTVTSLLAGRLGFRRVSLGDLHRQMAQARGMSALQLNLHAERDEAVDERIDQLQAEMAKSNEPLIVDSRLGWFFFTEALTVNLITEPTVAAQRAMSRAESDVEAYSSIAEAVGRLKSRSDSERIRFLRKYNVDKAQLRNYNIICDTTRAKPEEVADAIVDAFNGGLYNEILSHTPPLVILDPARIYPSDDIRGLRGLWESGFVEDINQGGWRSLEPISVAYADQYFFVLDGHRRLSAALQNSFTLIAARLIAQDEEYAVADLSAKKYFEGEVSLSKIYDWDEIHGIELPLPPHFRPNSAE